MSQARFLKSTHEVEKAEIRTKEQAMQFIKDNCRKSGCNCDPDIVFTYFEVDEKNRETKVEAVINHQAHCIFGTAARA